MDEEYRRYIMEQSKMYLQYIRSLIHSVKQLKGEIEEVEALASGVTGIDYSQVRVSSSPSGDRMERLVMRLDALRDEYAAELDGYLAEQREAHACIGRLEQPYAMLLTLRYVQGLPWADVAEAIGYTDAYARTNLHEAALCDLYPHLPRQWRGRLYSAI